MARATITICLDEPVGRIRPELYGHFAEHLGACIDEGIWVGEHSRIPNLNGVRTDVLDALRQIRPPVIRWPGGCYADDYHWEDGVGPRTQRPRRVNVWWGQNVETNAFGTHEFIDVCRYLGAEPYLAGNVGSGSPREMRDWVEYCNFAGDSTLTRRRRDNGSAYPFNVRYWGVGNEAWGCGGNFCPEDYAKEYKRYATYLRDYSGTELFLVACGPDGNNHDWTRRFLRKALDVNSRWNARLHGYAAHYYCGTAGPGATEFDVSQWYELLDKARQIETLIHDQRALLDEFDPGRTVGLVIDEWGTWHLPTPGRNPHHLWQQSTLRDALVAGITLNIFNQNAHRLVMANIAQMVNVLQSLVLTRGGRMVLTPTYHVFDLYQSHQNATSYRTIAESPAIPYPTGGRQRRELPGLFAAASRLTGSGELTLSVVNPHATLPAEVTITLRGGATLRDFDGQVLTHEDLTAHNTFDAPDTLSPRLAEVRAGAADGPAGPAFVHVFPPASVSVLRLRLNG